VRERDDRPGSAAAAWAAAGMLALTGRPGHGPLGPPAPLVDGVQALAGALSEGSARLGSRLDVDPFGLLAERAALAGLTRHGPVSCGGGTRLLRTADGWAALSLARPSDWDLVAALLDLPRAVAPGDWAIVEQHVADRAGGHLRARATLLGVPLGVLGERAGPPGDRDPSPVPSSVRGLASSVRGIVRHRVAPAAPVGSLRGLVVADLSSLWAGPLAGRLLGSAGAEVVKVESTTRPDGARWGPTEFFDRLNGGKASVALDLTADRGRSRLRQLVGAADVVITSSRPRALEQLGIDPPSLMAVGRPKVWLMVSGYGHTVDDGLRVAFGDDAAVAGGLVAWDGMGPCFCGDAVADPLTGLAGAGAVLAALEAPGAWILEASMADIAGGLTGPALPIAGLHSPPPVIRSTGTVHPAPDLGADNGRVLRALGVG
jgi:hypothetical protein